MLEKAPQDACIRKLKTGYILLFIQRLVFPSEEPLPTKEELT